MVTFNTVIAVQKYIFELSLHIFIFIIVIQHHYEFIQPEFDYKKSRQIKMYGIIK